jgi:hypothetical protein
VGVAQYAHEVAYVEWPYVAKQHKEDPSTDTQLNEVWKAVTQLKPRSATEVEFVRRAVDDITEANVSRRDRIDQARSELPTPLWVVLIVGGALTIGFCYFFSLDSFASQAAMVSILATLIALSLFVILVLDLPFSGDVAVAPTALEDEISEFCTYNFVHPRLPGNCDALSRSTTASTAPPASTGPPRLAWRSTSAGPAIRPVALRQAA